jgi:hypothetical protein
VIVAAQGFQREKRWSRYDGYENGGATEVRLGREWNVRG